jgi:hypothetical protein
MSLDRGAFVLSLDFELIWGTVDAFGPEAFRAACERERDHVFGRLVDLLDQYEIRATWCVLGHIMLGSCAPVNGRKHPEIVRPRHAWHPQDWFRHDPCGDERTDPIFYGRSLVQRLLVSPTPQEIGGHGFSHVVLGDPGCSRETAESELRASAEAARELGVTLRSFAFPRNRVGHLDVLREYGFTCFRGPEPTWHGGGTGGLTGAHRRAGHLLDVVTARRPPVGVPEMAQGLVNIPASMAYFPMHGSRRHIPISRRVARILKGVESARRKKRVFHLWFHPTNLADHTDTMLRGLESVFESVADRRERGEIEVLPMGELADRAALRACER